MKKYIALLCGIALLFSLAGCKKESSEESSSGVTLNGSSKTSESGGGNQSGGGSGGTMKDGTYDVEAEEADENGFKPIAKVTIQDGQVYAVTFDALKEDGTSKKALSESGQYGMKAKGNSQGEWHEEIALLQKAIVEKGVNNIAVNGEGKTDTVTGCTISVGPYIELVMKAEEEAKSSGGSQSGGSQSGGSQSGGSKSSE